MDPEDDEEEFDEDLEQLHSVIIRNQRRAEVSMILNETYTSSDVMFPNDALNVEFSTSIASHSSVQDALNHTSDGIMSNEYDYSPPFPMHPVVFSEVIDSPESNGESLSDDFLPAIPSTPPYPSPYVRDPDVCKPKGRQKDKRPPRRGGTNARYKSILELTKPAKRKKDRVSKAVVKPCSSTQSAVDMDVLRCLCNGNMRMAPFLQLLEQSLIEMTSDDGRRHLIQCESCKVWMHLTCELPKAKLKDVERDDFHFVCSKCVL
jgi:hypothetical protein